MVKLGNALASCVLAIDRLQLIAVLTGCIFYFPPRLTKSNGKSSCRTVLEPSVA
jgi:hypothetical protein